MEVDKLPIRHRKKKPAKPHVLHLLAMPIKVLNCIFYWLIIPVERDPRIQQAYDEWRARKMHVWGGGNYRTNFYFGIHPVTLMHKWLHRLTQTCKFMRRWIFKYRNQYQMVFNGYRHRRFYGPQILRIENRNTVQTSKHKRCLRRQTRKAKKMMQFHLALPEIFTLIMEQFIQTKDYIKNQVNKPKYYVDWYSQEKRWRSEHGTKWYFMARISRHQKFQGLRLDQIVLCKAGSLEESFWVLICKHFKAKVKFHDENDDFVFTIRLGSNEKPGRNWIEAPGYTSHRQEPTYRGLNFPKKKKWVQSMVPHHMDKDY